MLLLGVVAFVVYRIHPDLLTDLAWESDPYAIIRMEELREALDEQILLYYRSEAVKEAIALNAAQGNDPSRLANARVVAITGIRAKPKFHHRTTAGFYADAREGMEYVLLEIEGRIGDTVRRAQGEASLSRRQWVLYSVTLDPLP